MPQQKETRLAWDISDRIVETSLEHKKIPTRAEVEWAFRRAIRELNKEYPGEN